MVEIVLALLGVTRWPDTRGTGPQLAPARRKRREMGDARAFKGVTQAQRVCFPPLNTVHVMVVLIYEMRCAERNAKCGYH